MNKPDVPHFPWWHWHRHLYNWVIHFAETPHGTTALSCLSFAESSFFPVPPDVLLAPLTLGAPKKWFSFALACSVASVLGGAFGYAVGAFLWDQVGDWVFANLGSIGFTPENFQTFQNYYDRYDFWIVFTCGFTPLPYKVCTISAGVAGISFRLPDCISARAARPVSSLSPASSAGKANESARRRKILQLAQPPVRNTADRRLCGPQTSALTEATRNHERSPKENPAQDRQRRRHRCRQQAAAAARPLRRPGPHTKAGLLCHPEERRPTPRLYRILHLRQTPHPPRGRHGRCRRHPGSPLPRRPHYAGRTAATKH